MPSLIIIIFELPLSRAVSNQAKSPSYQISRFLMKISRFLVKIFSKILLFNLSQFCTCFSRDRTLFNIRENTVIIDSFFVIERFQISIYHKISKRFHRWPTRFQGGCGPLALSINSRLSLARPIYTQGAYRLQI